MAISVVNSFKDIASHDRLISDLSEAIKNKVFYEDVSDFFRIQPNIKGGQQVVALDPLEYVTTKDEGCGSVGQSFSIKGISQVWEPQLAKVSIRMCYTEFMDSFTRWGLANGYDIHNLEEADFFNYIKDTVAEAMKADFLRLALFGDEDIATQNILTDKTKAPYYSVIKKGLIPTLQVLATNPEFKEQIKTEARLSNALNALKGITSKNYFDSDQILTSLSIWEDYFNSLLSFPVESTKQDVKNGVPKLSYMGRELKPIRFYDKKRFEDFYDGKTVYLPHFAINTSKDNLVIGVDDVNSLTDLRMEYVGGSDEHFYIKANYMMDFKIPNPKALKAFLGSEEVPK